MTYSIFVFGISGVGKTTACKAFVERNPRFCYISASEVLRRASGLSIESLRLLSRADIQANQLLLARALPSEMSGCAEQFVLVDAQNVIDNGIELVEVPITIVEPLEPRGIILLEAQPNVVWERRKNDIRSRPVRTPEEIEVQMRLIRSVTHEYGAKLQIPIAIREVIPGFQLDEIVYEFVAS